MQWFFDMSSENKGFIRNLMLRLVISLLIIALAAAGSQLVFLSATENLNTSAAEINVAGRQRMLSQRISFLAEKLDNMEESEQRNGTRKKLKNAIDLMEKSHEALLHGNSEMGIASVKSDKILAHFLGPVGSLDFDVRTFIAQARTFLAQHEDNVPARAGGHDHSVDLENLKSDELLIAIDKLVKQYQLAAEKDLANSLVISNASLAIILILLVFIGLFVFRPMLRKIEVTFTQLRQSKEIADAANTAKSDFLSSMSHELRTPMNSILGFAQLLELDESHPLSEQQKSHLRYIVRGGEHLLELINQVLDLARVESGHMTLSQEKVNASNVCKDALVLVENLAADREIELLSDLDEDLFIKVDYTRLKQALLNLLSNAIKYNRRSGRVILTCRTTSSGKARFTVSDTGEGIPHEKQKGLFEPFNRLGKEGSDIEGTGIGLLITKQIIEAMGGDIGVESEAGRGSDFWLEFDVLGQTSQIVAAQPPESAKSNTRNGSGDVKGVVLYVEDNPANMKLMETILARMENVQLITAMNAEQGISLARQLRPRLIFMDINLPGMDGIQALKALKTHPETESIPVVAVSAAAMERDIERGLSAGFKAYLSKPFSITEVISVLEEELGEPLKP